MKIQRFAYDIIYYVLWLIEVILLLRFLLKLLGANPYNALVTLAYSLSTVFMGPFTGIFGNATAGNMILEPSVLVAMICYAVIAYVLVTLLKLLTLVEKNVPPSGQ